MTSAPIWEAISFCDATIPFWARVGTEIAATVIERSATLARTTTVRAFMGADYSCGGGEGRCFLDPFQLPRAAAKQQSRDDGHDGKRDGHGQENALGTVAKREPEHV